MQDLTTGQVMFNYTSFVSNLGGYKYNQGARGWGTDLASDRGLIDVDFTPGDSYYLYLYAHTQSNDDDASIFVNLTNVQATPVPLPPTILLLGTGLAGLVGFKRKFRK